MIKYRKHTALLILMMICITLIPVAAYADDGDIIKDEGNMFQRAVAGLLDFFNQMIVSLWDSVGFKSLSELVFATGLSDAEKDSLPWQPNQVTYVYKFYIGLMMAVMPIYIILISVSAYRFLSAAINPRERLEAKESIMRLLYGLILMLLAPFIVEVLMQASLFVTSAIATAFSSIGNVQDLNSLSVDLLRSDTISTGSFLGTVIVKIMFGIIFLYFNVLYIIRMVAISVMFVFTPVMAMAWMINKNATALQVWLGELASNAFMPVAHALVLCVILMLTDVKEVSNGSWVTIIIMLYTLIPLAETVRNSLQSIVARLAGFDGERTAKSVMAGVIGVASLARLGQATFGSTSGGNPALPNTRKSDNWGAGSNMMPPGREKHQMKNTYSKPITVQQSDGTTTQGTARVYNTPSRNATMTKIPTIGTAGKVGGIAGAATKIASLPVILGAGAIPGGQQIVQGGAKVVEGATRKATTAVVAGSQIAKAYAQTRNIGQSLQKVTGTTNKKEALGRIINPDKATSYQVPKKFKAVRHGNSFRVEKRETQAVKKRTVPKSQQGNLYKLLP